MKTPFYKLKSFYVALAALLFVILKNLFPAFPFTADDLLGLVLFVVGLLGWQIENALYINGFFNGS